METVIVSLGGSLIVPDAIDKTFLKKFRTLILSLPQKFVIVTGGGKTCREYNDAAKAFTKPKPDDLDWMGIAATRLNAELVRVLFGKKAYKEVVENPTKKVLVKQKILVACGWKPGCSSDMDAVLWAKTFGAKKMFNLSNTLGVYSADPKKDSRAVLLDTISWKDYRKMIGNKWSPGLNTPFDPTASRKADQLKLEVVVAKGTNLANVKKALTGKPFKGTLIS